MSHQCPVSACRWTLGDDSKLMCPKHWHMVPRPLQRAVYQAYGRGAGLGTTALICAQLAAIGAVNATLAGTRHTVALDGCTCGGIGDTGSHSPPCPWAAGR
jgi:hypothetical protein